MKILITGFEPFGEHRVNPSQKLLALLPERLDGGFILKKLILPVDHNLAPGIVTKAIHEEDPDGVLAFGLAAGRSKISLERIAINLLDFRIPDNTGVTITDKPVILDGPAAYFSTFPVHAILRALLETGIPAEISLSAGSYLCNQVFYSILHEIDTQHLQIPAGFIHLPALPEAAAKSKKSVLSMDIGLMVKASKIIMPYLASKQ